MSQNGTRPLPLTFTSQLPATCPACQRPAIWVQHLHLMGVCELRCPCGLRYDYWLIGTK